MGLRKNYNYIIFSSLTIGIIYLLDSFYTREVLTSELYKIYFLNFKFFDILEIARYNLVYISAYIIPLLYIFYLLIEGNALRYNNFYMMRFINKKLYLKNFMFCLVKQVLMNFILWLCLFALYIFLQGSMDLKAIGVCIINMIKLGSVIVLIFEIEMLMKILNPDWNSIYNIVIFILLLMVDLYLSTSMVTLTMNVVECLGYICIVMICIIILFYFIETQFKHKEAN